MGLKLIGTEECLRMSAKDGDLVAQNILVDYLIDHKGDEDEILGLKHFHYRHFEMLKVDLKRANRRRVKRILSLRQVIQCAIEAKENRWSWVSGRDVGNSYGYFAEKTVCVCGLRSDGMIRAEIAVVSAHRSSPTTAILGLTLGQEKKILEMITQWADSI